MALVGPEKSDSIPGSRFQRRSEERLYLLRELISDEPFGSEGYPQEEEKETGN